MVATLDRRYSPKFIAESLKLDDDEIGLMGKLEIIQNWILSQYEVNINCPDCYGSFTSLIFDKFIRHGSAQSIVRRACNLFRDSVEMRHGCSTVNELIEKHNLVMEYICNLNDSTLENYDDRDELFETIRRFMKVVSETDWEKAHDIFGTHLAVLPLCKKCHRSLNRYLMLSMSGAFKYNLRFMERHVLLTKISLAGELENGPLCSKLH